MIDDLVDTVKSSIIWVMNILMGIIVHVIDCYCDSDELHMLSSGGGFTVNRAMVVSIFPRNGGVGV